MRCSTSCIHAVVPSCRLFPILNMPCFPTPKQLNNTCQSHYRIVASKRGTPSPCSFRILTRLNHFNLRLRPIGLRPSCLTFGVTSACPMFAIRWLTYLAGTGFPPAGIIDLARPHAPFHLITKDLEVWLKYLSVQNFKSSFLKPQQTAL